MLHMNTWNPNGAPRFGWKRGPCFGGLLVSPQNRGQFQVPGIHINIIIYTFFLPKILSIFSFCTKKHLYTNEDGVRNHDTRLSLLLHGPKTIGGGFNQFKKYARQIGPQVRMKIKNIQNHHLAKTTNVKVTLW